VGTCSVYRGHPHLVDDAPRHQVEQRARRFPVRAHRPHAAGRGGEPGPCRAAPHSAALAPGCAPHLPCSRIRAVRVDALGVLVLTVHPVRLDVGAVRPRTLRDRGHGDGLAVREGIHTRGQTLGPRAAYGVAGVVASVTIHSASAVAVKRIGSQLPALAVTAGALLVAVPLYVAVFLASGESMPSAIPARGAIAIVYLGLVGSVLGFVLYYHVLRHVEASRVALITLVTPVVALLLGHAFGGEPLQPQVWAGGGTILAGLWLYQLGPR
jgi:uncharacterized membrane protein